MIYLQCYNSKVQDSVYTYCNLYEYVAVNNLKLHLQKHIVVDIYTHLHILSFNFCHVPLKRKFLLPDGDQWHGDRERTMNQDGFSLPNVHSAEVL